MNFPKIKREFLPTDAFFEDGNIEREEKIATVEYVNEITEPPTSPKKEFKCDVQGCSSKFNDLFSYEQHYNTVHRLECSFCRKNFITKKILEIHILENHDTLFEFLAKKKNMVRCVYYVYFFSMNVLLKDVMRNFQMLQKEGSI